jgi:hypothetical protein
MSFREIRYFDCKNYIKRHPVANMQNLMRVRKYYLQLLLCFRRPRVMCVVFLRKMNFSIANIKLHFDFSLILRMPNKIINLSDTAHRFALVQTHRIHKVISFRPHASATNLSLSTPCRRVSLEV